MKIFAGQEKNSGSVVDFTFDWRQDWLAEEESIATYTVQATGLTVEQHSQSNGQITVWLSGGEPGTSGTVKCHIVTDNTPVAREEDGLAIITITGERTALIVETGAGVYGANAYVTREWVDDYLSARNRLSENGWSSATFWDREAAIIAGADYIDKKFGSRFRGRPSFQFVASYATASITFSGLPDAGDTLTIGDEVWTFVSALTGYSREILIGADAAGTAANLSAAVGLTRSRHATAASAGAVVALAATAPGAGGAFTRLSGTVANATISPFVGGTDGAAQSLAWPRYYAYDGHGILINGVPDIVRRANAEYAVRSLAAPLFPDPSEDVGIKRKLEKVGPIEEETEYQTSRATPSAKFPRYPAVDRMLIPLLTGWGGVIRG